MDRPDASPLTGDVLTQSEVERLLAQVAEQEEQTTERKSESGRQVRLKENVQAHDFRNPTFLSAAEMRRLRVLHEEFAENLTSRLSIYLRAEVTLQISQVQTLTYQKFTSSLANPVHLTLFKMEPLRGICVLDINPRLGLTMVDRLMGGPGHSITLSRDLSEIEVALLDQAVLTILGEWCGLWTKMQDLQPLLLGHENSGKFLQTSQPDAVVLLVTMQARLGDCLEQIQIAFPYQTIESLIQKLNKKLDTTPEQSGKTAVSRVHWKPNWNDVQIPVTAEFSGLRLTMNDLSRMKVGDVIPLDSGFVNEIQLRLARTPKFAGKLGTQGTRWAVEICEVKRT